MEQILSLDKMSSRRDAMDRFETIMDYVNDDKGIKK